MAKDPSSATNGVEAALRAAFGPDSQAPRREAVSVLPAIEKITGAKSMINLPEPPGDDTPLVKTRFTELAEGPGSDGRYQILGEIARGGVGSVMKGRDVDLGRDIAIKVLLPSHAADSTLVQRFVEEAQIGAQLQHPGIVPVYDIGLRYDQRPYFTMKLVKGQTLSAMLQSRANPTEKLQDFIRIFEKVCETMAYAHARRIIHRDLKPANIMIGSFGEVKIVDWGFAKVLDTGGIADERRASQTRRPAVSIIETVRSASVGSQSIAGSLMGTPAYMPPEQALGDVDHMDARSDVFSLGAILCEILTGKPPYVGDDNTEIVADAAAGKIDGAYARLDACGADQELIRISKRCLAAVREVRPAEGEVLSKAVSGYLTSVAERARASEIEAVEAKANAEAAHARVRQERKAKRLTLALAGTVLLSVVIGGGFYFNSQSKKAERIQQANNDVATALQEATLSEEKARNSGDVAHWVAAVGAAQRAEIAMGDADLDHQSKVTTVLARVRTGEETAREAAAALEKDRDMVTRLENIRTLKGMSSMATDRDYTKAFADYGIEVDAGDAKRAALGIRDSRIQLDLTSALDDWSWVRTNYLGLAEGQKLLMIARDADPDDTRNKLRDTLMEEELAKKLLRLQGIAKNTDLATMEPMTLRLLGATLAQAGDVPRAVEVLDAAQRRHGRDFWINYEYAYWLTKLVPPAWNRALRYYTAALALRPESAPALNNRAVALMETNEIDAALVDLRQAVKLNSTYVRARVSLGKALSLQGRYDDAMTQYEAALSLEPNNPLIHNNIGSVYQQQENLEKAIESYRSALELDNEYVSANANLVEVLAQKGEFKEALERIKRVIDEDESAAWAWSRLGHLLGVQNKPLEAVEALEKAVQLDPNLAEAYNNLGGAHHRAGRWDKAIKAYTRATEIAPNDNVYRFNLGFAHYQNGEPGTAIRHYRHSIKLNPNYAPVRDDLALALYVHRDDREGAEREYRKAIEISMKAYGAQQRLGSMYGSYLSASEALTRYQEIVDEPTKEAKSRFLASLAGALSNRGETEDARKVYEETIKNDPESIGAHRGVANGLIARMTYDEAVAAYEKLVPDGPSEGRAEFFHRIGDALMARGDLDGALAAYEEWTFIDPRNSLLHYHLGQLYARQARYGKTNEHFAKALERNKGLLNTHTAIGVSFGERMDFDEAMENYVGLVGTEIPATGAAEFWTSYGTVRWNLHDERDDAIKALREAIRMDPSHARAHGNLGYAFGNLYSPAEAVTRYSELVTEPTELAAHSFLTQMGRGRLAEGDHKGAIRAYRLAIRKLPRNVLPHGYLGTELARDHDFLGAKEAYFAIIGEPTDAAAGRFWAALAVGLRNRRDFAGALRANDEYEKLYPRAIRTARIAILIAKGDYEDALQLCEGVFERWPWKIWYETQRASIYQQKGDYRSARIALEKLVDRTRGGPVASNSLAWVLCAPADESERDPKRALPLAERAVELHPGSNVYLITLALAQYRLGKWKEAIASVDKSTEYSRLASPSLRGQVILAMAAFKAGDKKRANKAFEEAASSKTEAVDRVYDRLQAEAAAVLGR